MRYKVLTVDDSKTVRLIVKKAFKPFDCEILEAANGVEGLAVAAKERPELVILDVTMPVMDGVEMLTRLKADPALKQIPVVMLTAEGGRDHVLKIAKIGVRDYVVKPFKEEVLIDKCSRIIDLKPVAEATAKARTILDPADLLLVEDKPGIVQQIQDGLRHTPWTVRAAATPAEAIDQVGRTTPDVVLISLSLPEEGAFALFRALRTNVKTKYTPVFAMVVKTDVDQQQRAQTLGFTTIVTKPIDLPDVEAKIAKAMNLDTSGRYFSTDADTVLLRLPESCTPGVLAEVGGYVKPKFAEAVDAGLYKVIIDLQHLRSLHVNTVKLLFQVMQTSRELTMQFALVGSPQIISECRGFEDTRGWTFHLSLDEAKAGLTRAAAAPTLAA